MAENKVTVLGTIANVTYPKKNYKDGGWAVFQVTPKKILSGEIDCHIKNDVAITFAGETPSLYDDGTEYVITGELTDSKYGLQYKVIMMNVNADLSDRERQEAFLSAILPPVTTQNLFKAFKDPILLLQTGDVDKLITIPGIGSKTAEKLIDRYQKNIGMGSAYAELISYGMTKRMIDKLSRKFKSADKLVNMIHDNPYLLIKYADGIGWQKADLIARSHGMSDSDPKRIDAFVDYYLTYSAEQDGHTWVSDRVLYTAIKSNAPTATDDVIGRCVRNKISINELYRDDSGRIGKSEYRTLEQKLTDELFRIANSKPPFVDYVDETIAECEKKVGFQYTDEQKDVIRHIVLDNQVSIVTGLGGSGKSSIMLPITQILLRNGLHIAQCCLSGKAALNLTEITGIDGKTIHRLLGYTPKGKDDEDDNGDNDEKYGERQCSFVHNHNNKLTDDVIIIDELSMVGGRILYSLLQSIKDGAKLIVIGDPGQLEAIGLCNCLHDMCESEVLPHYHLSKIMRQAENSAIITESVKIYNKEQIITPSFHGETIRGINRDFKIVSADDQEEELQYVMENFHEIYQNGKTRIEDIVIVTSKRSTGILSSRNINSLIHNEVTNKSDSNVLTVKYCENKITWETDYRAGDRILITKNCYNTKNEAGEICPVFNGNLGTIIWVDPEVKMMCVNVLGDRVVLDEECIYNMQLGYAITCHKCQGSGFPYVIAVSDPSAFPLNTKEMLYTQITRAKKYCVLIGQPSIICQSINKTNVKKKQTWMTELLQKKFA